MKYKIIADSSCDLSKDYLENTNIDFDIAPLSINVNGKEFIDDENINIEEMLSAMSSFKGKTTTACPSPNAYLEKMTGADKYFIITISSELSGSYNAAVTAKNMHSSPDNIFVIDSKQTSGSMILIIDKLVELTNENLSYEEICKEIDDYTKNHLELLFVLNKFDNLVKNGRMSPAKAMIANALRIRLLCRAENGNIQVAKKAIGAKRIFKELIESIKNKIKNVFSKCIITHCQNEEMADEIKNTLHETKQFKEIKILKMNGLCSFYAMQKGIIVCLEK